MRKNYLTTKKTLLKSQHKLLTIKLQRHQSELVQLEKKLSSYKYEPHNQNLFEQLQSLKNKMGTLRSTNGALVALLKHPNRRLPHSVEVINQQYSTFNSIKKGVNDYIRCVQD